jgi:hypothetical protein
MTFMKRGVIANADIDSLEVVATIETEGMKTLWLDFSVSVAALTGFAIDFQLRETGNWLSVANTGAAFTTPTHPVVRASGDLTGAGTSGVHWCRLDVSGVWAVRIRAAGASSNLLGSFSLG